MDLQAAERDPRDQITYNKKIWRCPCQGCKKAAKQERERILKEIAQIDLTKLNGLGMKMLVIDIVKGPDEKKVGSQPKSSKKA